MRRGWQRSITLEHASCYSRPLAIQASQTASRAVCVAPRIAANTIAFWRVSHSRRLSRSGSKPGRSKAARIAMNRYIKGAAGKVWISRLPRQAGLEENPPRRAWGSGKGAP